MESEGHNCYQAIRDKGFHNLDLSNKRICGDLAKVIWKVNRNVKYDFQTAYKLLKRRWNNPPTELQNLLKDYNIMQWLEKVNNSIWFCSFWVYISTSIRARLEDLCIKYYHLKYIFYDVSHMKEFYQSVHKGRTKF